MGRRQYFHCDFDSVGATTQNDATVAAGATGDSNLINIGGEPWETFILGAGQTILTPKTISTADLGGTKAYVNLAQDAVENEGVVYTPFTNGPASPLQFTIGTSPAFFVKARFLTADYTEVDPLAIGFHGGAVDATFEAHQTAIAGYTDLAAIGVFADDIKTQTSIDSTDVLTDTTVDATDSAILELKVLVSAAGAVTYQYGSAGAALAEPTTVVAFSFTDGDVVCPFIYALLGGTPTNPVQCLDFTCGLQ